MKRNIFVSLFILLFHAGLWAQNVGAAAPDFTHATTDDDSITLSYYKGKVVYLFFFGYS